MTKSIEEKIKEIQAVEPNITQFIVQYKNNEVYIIPMRDYFDIGMKTLEEKMHQEDLDNYRE